ncbi:MDR family MFS transporter [Acetilactobacillus jinshanensis]|uniref:DHA2 family efflux MFS transporter permease subunit n=1 Tax=Acetilactobacillus jinshanensis TaxID=1720083 RepID=A0A4P6ZJL6_9LACO|nr:MDR family MFS transporter [Acetilactobacillus jinshanensis]QBP17723.1 DHA2 family efflux MFS transporter permease subunit [Acetilactobacillus jinshanensis]URL61733.1 multidrug efflux MFS transporter [uncultured bacterium]
MTSDRIVDKNGKPFNRPMMVLILLIGGFFTMLNETVLATAYPKLMSYFSVNASTVQWLTSAFLMVNGIMIPLTAWLTARYNTKWLYLFSVIIFEVGTIMAYVATSFSILLVARIIQAISVGIAMPLFQTIMLSIYPPEHRGVAMGMAGLVIGLSPAVGPTLSGWIIDNASWRDLFGMNIIPMALVLLLGLVYIKPVLHNHRSPLDYWSVVWSSIGFGFLLYGFSSVGSDGWTSWIVLSSLLIGLIFVGVFVRRELSIDDPLLNLKVFKSFKFNLGTIIGSLAMMSLVGFEMILPLYLQTMHGDSAFRSGLTLLPGALLVGIFAPITGRLFDRFGARDLSISGFIFLTAGTIPFIFLTQHTSTLYIVVLYGIRSVGIAMSMMTITTYSMNALPDRLINHGTSANNTVKQIASSIATAILTSVLSNTTNGDKPMHHMLMINPLKYKDHMLNAAMNGYHAAFVVAIIFGVIGLVATFLVKKHDRGFTAETRKELN